MLIDNLIKEMSSCRLCEKELPHGPNPIFKIHPQAKILIISQAPGSKAHASGIPWDDPGGRELRRWMGISDDTFYKNENVGILPMGFCYPGKGKTGDLPPRKECAPKWHPLALPYFENVKLKLIVGQYAQKAYLNETWQGNLTKTVKHYLEIEDEMLALPHPSPRNRFWLRKNDWFEALMIPILRKRVEIALR